MICFSLLVFQEIWRENHGLRLKVRLVFRPQRGLCHVSAAQAQSSLRCVGPRQSCTAVAAALAQCQAAKFRGDTIEVSHERKESEEAPLAAETAKGEPKTHRMYENKGTVCQEFIA